jgi:hypothetical protein
MSETTDPADWMTVPAAAAKLGRDLSKVYKWLRRDPETTKILTKIVRDERGDTKRVHFPSLVDYVSTLRPGPPRRG